MNDDVFIEYLLLELVYLFIDLGPNLIVIAEYWKEICCGKECGFCYPIIGETLTANIKYFN